MGATRLAVYLVGLLVVVLAAWVFLTQTTVGRNVPTSVALVLILLLAGIGIMASARSINDSRSTRRVVRDSAGYAPPASRVYESRYASDAPVESETVVEERRLD